VIIWGDGGGDSEVGGGGDGGYLSCFEGLGFVHVLFAVVSRLRMKEGHKPLVGLGFRVC